MRTFALTAATAAVVASTMSASAFAYDRQGRIDLRQARQADRIRHERRNGDLTALETWVLKAEQARIARMERHALRDGYISRNEAARISAAQDKASYDIYRLGRNGRTAWWRW